MFRSTVRRCSVFGVEMFVPADSTRNREILSGESKLPVKHQSSRVPPPLFLRRFSWRPTPAVRPRKRPSRTRDTLVTKRASKRYRLREGTESFACGVFLVETGEACGEADPRTYYPCCDFHLMQAEAVWPPSSQDCIWGAPNRYPHGRENHFDEFFEGPKET